MYHTFFGLNEKPFDLIPNPEYLYPSRTHQRAITYLTHGVRERAGFILLTGEVGSGKTTIIRDMVNKQLRDVVLSKVFQTKVDSHQLLALINDDFGIPTEGKDKATLLRDLNDFLIEQYSMGRQAVLIIDEAQNLSLDLLEEVRMLSNLETDRDKLLQIILVGQPELRQILSATELLQLRQRIQINCHISPLNEAEVSDYIHHRLERAGNRNAVAFSPGAIAAISKYSRGVPRLINIICDFILLDAYAAQSRDISEETVEELARDLSFEKQYWEVRQDAQPAAPQAIIDQYPAGPAVAVSGQAGASRTALKLNNLLRSMSRRIEMLEAESGKFNETALVELKDRVGELELLMRQQADEFGRAIQMLRMEMAQIRNRLPERPVAPVAGPRVEIEKPQKKNFIWQFLTGG